MSLRADLSAAIAAARDRAIAAGDLTLPEGAEPPAIGLERPAKPEHGDWASNAAMQLAPVARAAPMRIADTLVAHFEPPPSVAEVSIAAPGFLNLRLDPAWLAGQVEPIRAAGPEYGRNSASEPRRINVEFVSANPTGPLHVGNARGAFVGDVLCRVLSAAGHRWTREYYFNDFGAQVVNLGLAVLARRRGSGPPRRLPRRLREDLVAKRARGPPGPRRGDGRRGGTGRRGWASERVRAGIESSLGAARRPIRRLDERELAPRDGWVERGMARLRAGGHMYEADGATWFRSTAVRRRQGSRRSIGPRAAQRTSPPTSATSPRSSAVASTSSSTSGASTTTGRWRAATMRPPGARV